MKSWRSRTLTRSQKNTSWVVVGSVNLMAAGKNAPLKAFCAMDKNTCTDLKTKVCVCEKAVKELNVWQVDTRFIGPESATPQEVDCALLVEVSRLLFFRGPILIGAGAYGYAIVRAFSRPGTSVTVCVSLSSRPLYWCASGLWNAGHVRDAFLAAASEARDLNEEWLRKGGVVGSLQFTTWFKTVDGSRMSHPCPLGLIGIRRRRHGDLEKELIRAGIELEPGPIYGGTERVRDYKRIEIAEIPHGSSGYVSIALDYRPGAPFDANVYAMIYIESPGSSAKWVRRIHATHYINVTTEGIVTLCAISYCGSTSDLDEVTHPWTWSPAGMLVLEANPEMHEFEVEWNVWLNPTTNRVTVDNMLSWNDMPQPLWTSTYNPSYEVTGTHVIRDGEQQRAQKLMHALNGNIDADDCYVLDHTGSAVPAAVAYQFNRDNFSNKAVPTTYSVPALFGSVDGKKADTINYALEAAPFVPRVLTASSPAVMTLDPPTPAPAPVAKPEAPPTSVLKVEVVPSLPKENLPLAVISVEPKSGEEKPVTPPVKAESATTSTSSTADPNKTCTVDLAAFPTIHESRTLKIRRQDRKQEQVAGGLASVTTVVIPKLLDDLQKSDLSARVFVWLSMDRQQRNAYSLLDDCEESRILLSDASDEEEIHPRVTPPSLNNRPQLISDVPSAPKSPKAAPVNPPLPVTDRRQQRAAVIARLSAKFLVSEGAMLAWILKRPSASLTYAVSIQMWGHKWPCENKMQYLVTTYLQGDSLADWAATFAGNTLRNLLILSCWDEYWVSLTGTAWLFDSVVYSADACKHNKVMHSVNGNPYFVPSKQAHDATPDYDAWVAAAKMTMCPEPWQDLGYLTNLPFINQANTANHNLNFYATVPYLRPDRTVVQDVTTRCRGAWVHPRQLISIGGPLINCPHRLSFFTFSAAASEKPNLLDSETCASLIDASTKAGNLMGRADATLVAGFHSFDCLCLAKIKSPQGFSMVAPLLKLRLMELIVIQLAVPPANVPIASSLTQFAPNNAPPTLANAALVSSWNISNIFGENLTNGAGEAVFPFTAAGTGTVAFHLCLESVPAAERSSCFWVPGSLLDGDLIDGLGLVYFLIMTTQWPFAIYGNQTNVQGPLGVNNLARYVHNSCQVCVNGPTAIHIILPRKTPARNPDAQQHARALNAFPVFSGPDVVGPFPANAALDANWVGNPCFGYALAPLILSWRNRFSSASLQNFVTRLSVLSDIWTDYGFACDLAAYATVRFCSPQISAAGVAPVLNVGTDAMFARQFTPAGMQVQLLTADLPNNLYPRPDAYIPIFDPTSWNRVVSGLSLPLGDIKASSHLLFSHPHGLSYNVILALKIACAWTIEYAHLGFTAELWNRAWDNGQNLAARRVVYGHFTTVFSGFVFPGKLTRHMSRVYCAAQNHLPFRSSHGLTVFDIVTQPKSRNYMCPVGVGVDMVNYSPQIIDDFWLHMLIASCPRWMNHLPVGGSMDAVMYSWKGLMAKPLGTRWSPPSSHLLTYNLEMGQQAELTDDERWNVRLETTHYLVDMVTADTVGVGAATSPGGDRLPYDCSFNDPNYCANRVFSRAAAYSLGVPVMLYTCRECTVSVTDANARNHTAAWAGQAAFPLSEGYCMMQLSYPEMIATSQGKMVIRSHFLDLYEDKSSEEAFSGGAIPAGVATPLAARPDLSRLESWLSTRCSWPLSQIKALCYCARHDLYPNADDFDAWKKLTGLLPPQELITLTGIELKQLVPKAETRSVWDPGRRLLLDQLLADPKPKFDDDHCLPIWPARTKVDLSIRRTRLRDIAMAYRDAKLTARLEHILVSLPGFDLISVVNVCIFDWFLTDSEFNWFEFWKGLGAFDAAVDHFCATASYVDARSRLHNCAFPRKRVLQNATLAGYRNPPFPGFSLQRETEALAKSGRPHEDCGVTTFQSVAEECLQADPSPTTYVDFREFVTSGDWETSGASSEGVVEWTDGDASGHFKARKNVVPDVVDLEALADQAEASTRQVNKAIVKSELGKLRMAVSSDLLTYLKMSWIIKLMGHSYLRWSGSTLEEDVVEQHNRMCEMKEKLKGRWGLPFDYKKFDHQPTTQELQMIVRICVKQARTAVPPGDLTAYDRLAQNVIESFEHSTLQFTEDGTVRIYTVDGGVMSGLRLTTILGNAWNSVMTHWCLKLLDCFGVYNGNVQAWVRGDDTALVFDSYAKGLLFRLLYQAINAEGSDGKFGLFQGEFEFLRTWYNDEECYGYLGRALPGLSQRKPWSNTPWSEEAVLEQVYECTQVLRRRGADPERTDLYWKSVCQCWAKRKHASMNWISVPKSNGGLGLGVWSGKVPMAKRDVAPTIKLLVTNQTDWRAKRIQADYESWYPITRDEAGKLAHEQLLKKMSLDDVSAIAGRLRANVKPFPGWSCRQEILELGGLEMDLAREQDYLIKSSPTRFALPRRVVGTNDFGLHADKLGRWRLFCDVERVRERSSLLTRFHQLEPEFVDDVRRMQKRGLNQSQAVDWLTGSAPSGAIKSLHPCLTRKLATSIVDLTAKRLTKSRFRSSTSYTLFVCYVTNKLETSLASSALARSMYTW